MKTENFGEDLSGTALLKKNTSKVRFYNVSLSLCSISVKLWQSQEPFWRWHTRSRIQIWDNVSPSYKLEFSVFHIWLRNTKSYSSRITFCPECFWVEFFELLKVHLHAKQMVSFSRNTAVMKSPIWAPSSTFDHLMGDKYNSGASVSI